MEKEELQVEFGVAWALGMVPVAVIALMFSDHFSQAGFIIAFAALVTAFRTLLFQYVLGVVWEERNVLGGAVMIAACVFGLPFVPYSGSILLVAAVLTFLARKLS